MNDVVFENLLCDAAAQLREERLEKIKLPHKNRHIPVSYTHLTLPTT